MKIICDAAVLIGLASIARLDLLEKLFWKIYIPEGVYGEVVVRGGDRPGAKELDQAKWVKTVKVKDRTAVSLLASEFGIGESEVLVLGKELKADWLIIDDARARAAAISGGYRVVGLAGVLLLAKQRDLINEIKPLLKQLVKKKFRLSDRIIKEILKRRKNEALFFLVTRWVWNLCSNRNTNQRFTGGCTRFEPKNTSCSSRLDGSIF